MIKASTKHEVTLRFIRAIEGEQDHRRNNPALKDAATESLPRTFLSGTSGYLVELLNWDLYFIFCSLIAIPALIILRRIKFIIKDEKI